MKENKFYFVPKPVQADTIPGKDCLALSKVFGIWFLFLFLFLFFVSRVKKSNGTTVTQELQALRQAGGPQAGQRRA